MYMCVSGLIFVNVCSSDGLLQTAATSSVEEWVGSHQAASE